LRTRPDAADFVSIFNEQDPPEMRIGSGSTAHVHPLWLLETADSAFNPAQCVWEARFASSVAGFQLPQSGSAGMPGPLMQLKRMRRSSWSTSLSPSSRARRQSGSFWGTKGPVKHL
jgi:hypothetical protein